MPLYETAKYEVVKKMSKQIELRYYDKLFLAKTTTRMDNRYSSGFSRVFNYISGANQGNQKISMTTPVVSTTDGEYLSTGFVIPREFDDKAPKPTDPNVEIVEMEEGEFMVIQFSGAWTNKNFEKYNQLLLQYITNEDYIIQSESYILRYQPPFIPSFFRRNEIMYRVIKK